MPEPGRLPRALLAVLLLLLVCAGIGAVWGWSREAPRWPEVWTLLSHPALLPETDRFILLELRLPRLLTGLLAGMMLAGAGLGLQGIFRNPLMDPFILGVSGGGALGAGVALLLGWSFALAGVSSVSLMALLGAAGVVLLVIQLGRWQGVLLMDRLLLAGVALSSLCSSLLSLCLVLSGQGMDQVVYWILGSLAGRTWEDLRTLIPFALLGTALLLSQLQALNLLQTGEDTARSLGVRPARIQAVVLLSATLLSAAVVSVCGVIGFIGLMVPHMARLLTGSSDFRRLLIPSLCLGGLLLIAADALSRNLLASQEIPVGIFTALLGVPFFLSQLRRGESP
ncbi:MAG: FecCD family ABC transporter permease [Candidatus Sericytochromatia bacterium]